MDKKTKCYSVAIMGREAKGKAYLLTAFDGGSIFVPKSTVFGDDLGRDTETRYIWVAVWVLEAKEKEGKPFQHSTKRVGWYNPETRRVEVCKYTTTVITTTPEPLEPDDTPVEDLAK